MSKSSYFDGINVNMEFACYKIIYLDFLQIFEILLMHVDMSKFNNFASTELYVDFMIQHILKLLKF